MKYFMLIALAKEQGEPAVAARFGAPFRHMRRFSAATREAVSFLDTLHLPFADSRTVYPFVNKIWDVP